jgi:amidase
MSILRDAARAFMPYPTRRSRTRRRGPLAGLTFAVKDLFDVAGYPTSGGQPFVLAMSGIKTTTAPTVQRLLDAGARFVGKTITDELAFSMNGQNAHFGSPVNGAAPDRITGGSSSGSAAAVSNHLCDFALGSDTGGSVRAPGQPLRARRPAPDARAHQPRRRARPRAELRHLRLVHARRADLRARRRRAARRRSVAAARAHPSARADRPVGPARARGRRGAARAARSRRGGARRAAPVEVVLDGFDAMYWSFRYLQGREAWRTDGA